MGNEKLKLYIRFPKKIEEELEVKNLCPNIEAVHLARQKSARWCIVDFKTQEDLKEAINIFKNIKIQGKRVIVKPVKSKHKPLPFEKKSSSVKLVENLLEN